MTQPRPFTQPWADALRDAINADTAYAAAAANWTWPVALVLEATPHLGYDTDVAVRFDLHAGACRDARVVSLANTDAPFVLRAPYAVWKKVVRGLTDPVMAIALKQVILEGSLSILMMHVGSARALVACARTVPTHFPDEAD